MFIAFNKHHVMNKGVFVKNKKKAQSLMEYTILISIITLVVSALTPMLRRSSQSLMKTGADQIADQITGEQDFESSGYMINSQVDSKTTANKKTEVKNAILGEEEKENVVSTTTTVYKLSGE